MVALKRGVLAGLLAALCASGSEAQTVSSMQYATVPLTNQELLYIVQNGQPRKVHPQDVAPPLVVPTAPLLGGANNAFTVVTPQSPLGVASGILSLTIPSAELLGGTGSDFSSVSVGSELEIGGALNLTATGVSAGPYTNANITVNQYGRITAAANGSSCGAGFDIGTVLFADGADGCTGDTARLFWDTTANLSHGHNFEITGGDLSGWVLSLRSDQLGGWPSNRSEFRFGNNNADPADSYGMIQTFDISGNPAHTVINGGGGAVSMGAVEQTYVGQPASTQLAVNARQKDMYLQSFGYAVSFMGGLYAKDVGAPGVALELDLDRGPTHNVHITADNTPNDSYLKGRLALGGGTTASEVLDVTGNSNVSGVYKVGGSQITCADLSGGCTGGGGSGAIGGSGTSGRGTRWTGTTTVGDASFSDDGTTATFASVLGTVVTDSTTSRTLGATDCGKEIRFTNAGAITVTVPNSLLPGCNISMMQLGAGQITVVAGAGATFLANPHAFTKSFGLNAVIGVSVDTNSGGSAATFTFVGDGA